MLEEEKTRRLRSFRYLDPRLKDLAQKKARRGMTRARRGGKERMKFWSHNFISEKEAH